MEIGVSKRCRRVDIKRDLDKDIGNLFLNNVAYFFINAYFLIDNYLLNLWVLLEFVYCVSFKYNFSKCLHEDPSCGRNACMDKKERRINCTVLFKTIYYELSFLMIVRMMKILVQNRKHFYWFADLHFWVHNFFRMQF